MPKKDHLPQHDKYDLELPQSIIDSFARFLVPEIRKYYNTEQGRKEFAEWEARQKEIDKQQNK